MQFFHCYHVGFAFVIFHEVNDELIDINSCQNIRATEKELKERTTSYQK